MPQLGAVVAAIALIGVACSLLGEQHGGRLATWWLEFSRGDGGFQGIPAGADCKGNHGSAALPPAHRMFNTSTLSRFDGTIAGNPLLLVVLGEVFDVSEGARFYQRADASAKVGVDSIGYNIFVGRDSSRAFASGDFVSPRDDLEGLKPAEIASIVEWRSFYRAHKTYPSVGRLAGRYYDCTGKPTEALRDVEATAAASVVAQKAEAAMLAQFRSCDSIYKPAERISTISCTGGGFPRRLLWTVADGSGPGVVNKQISGEGAAPSSPGTAPMQRCVCLTKDEESAIRRGDGEGPTSSNTLRVEVYPDCASSDATTCRLKVS